MDLRSLIDKAIDLAKIGGIVLPPLKGGAVVAEKILDVLDGLKGQAPDDATAEQIEEAHEALYKRVTDAGHDLSKRLRGGEG